MRTVLVPGFTQTARSWDSVAERLRAAGLDPVALDVPDRLDFTSTAGALGDAGGTGVWVGYSMGGRLALQLALDRPELVRGLVLLGATPGLRDPDERRARREADAGLAAEAERDGVDAFLTRWLDQPLFESLPADASGSEDRRAANTPARIAHQLRVLGTGAMDPLWDRLGELRGPVTFAAGSLDTKFTAIATEMQERMPVAVDTRLTLVDGAGHAAHLERPDAFAAVVTELAGRTTGHDTTTR